MDERTSPNLDEVITRSVVCVDVDEDLRRIREIFEESKFHHLLVTQGGRVVGLISDRDLLKNISPFVGNTWMERQQDVNTLKRKAHQVMHRRLVVAHEEMSVDEATELMMEENVTCLPVVSADRRPRGIVTWRDVLRHHLPPPDATEAEAA